MAARKQGKAQRARRAVALRERIAGRGTRTTAAGGEGADESALAFVERRMRELAEKARKAKPKARTTRSRKRGA